MPMNESIHTLWHERIHADIIDVHAKFALEWQPINANVPKMGCLRNQGFTNLDY